MTKNWFPAGSRIYLMKWTNLNILCKVLPFTTLIILQVWLCTILSSSLCWNMRPWWCLSALSLIFVGWMISKDTREQRPSLSGTVTGIRFPVLVNKHYLLGGPALKLMRIDCTLLPFHSTLFQYTWFLMLTVKRIFIFLRCPWGCVAWLVSASSMLPPCCGVPGKSHLLCNIPFNPVIDFCLGF